MKVFSKKQTQNIIYEFWRVGLSDFSDSSMKDAVWKQEKSGEKIYTLVKPNSSPLLT